MVLLLLATAFGREPRTPEMPLPFQLSKEPVYSHCFTPDQSHLVISRANDALVYNMTLQPPQLVATLAHHDKPITAVDVSVTGLIVTCSQDRNALVWTKQADGQYKQTLVLLRINRAATCVKWSPNGLKFAVGSAARVISVCYYEEENDWWISKHIKKSLKSTILSLDWHQNGVLLAAGSTDGHVRVFSTWLKGIDEKPQPSIWGEKLPFQTICLDVYLQSWVHDVKFDPECQSVACVGHDGSLFIVKPNEPVFKLRTSHLPFTSLIFLNEAEICAAGYDCHPVVFKFDGQSWVEAYSMDKSNSAPKVSTVGEDGEANEQSAINMFRAMDLKGTKNSKSTLDTVHQNVITQLRVFQKQGNQVIRFSSSGDDGKVVVWDAKK